MSTVPTKFVPIISLPRSGSTKLFSCFSGVASGNQNIRLAHRPLTVNELTTFGNKNEIIPYAADNLDTSIGLDILREKIEQDQHKKPLTLIFKEEIGYETLDKHQEIARQSMLPDEIFKDDTAPIFLFREPVSLRGAVQGHEKGRYFLTDLGNFIDSYVNLFNSYCRAIQFQEKALAITVEHFGATQEAPETIFRKICSNTNLPYSDDMLTPDWDSFVASLAYTEQFEIDRYKLNPHKLHNNAMSGGAFRKTRDRSDEVSPLEKHVIERELMPIYEYIMQQTTQQIPLREVSHIDAIAAISR